MARIEGAGRTDLHMVDPEKITVPTSGPLYDERSALPVDENMVASILYRGQLQAILVRKNGPNLEVVSGRQRLKAILEINRRARERGEKVMMKVKAELVHGSDGELYGAMIAENEIRLADDVVVKAQKAKRLLKYGHTVQDIAKDYGVQVRAVNEWLSLTDVAPEVQAAIHSGEIAAGVGVELAKLPKDQQATKLAEWQAAGEGKPVTVQNARRNIRQAPGPKFTGAKAWSLRDLRALTDHLSSIPPDRLCGFDKAAAVLTEVFSSVDGAEDGIPEESLLRSFRRGKNAPARSPLASQQPAPAVPPKRPADHPAPPRSKARI